MSGSINLGRVRPKYVGAYDPDRSYDVLERVKYKGQIYECAVKTTAGIAPDSAEHGSVYWSQISVNNPVPQAVWDGTALSFEYPDGEVTTPVDLQGPQGIQGEPGEVNITSDLTSTATDVALSALAGKNLKAMIDNSGMGGVTLYDGPIDFTDEEQIEDITENKPIGNIVAYDCCNDCSTTEDVVIGGQFNTREIIEESGEWVAPVTGTCRITVIDGGNGGFANTSAHTINSGLSGAFDTVFRNFVKDQTIDVTIGAGGIGEVAAAYTSACTGGQTVFGDVYADSRTIVPSNTTWLHAGLSNYNRIEVSSSCVGGGAGYYDGANNQNGRYFGAGGGAEVRRDASGNYTFYVGNGYQGCVIVEYYDASKDKNISVDMASSVTMQELQNQIAALTARVQELENE